MSPLQMEMILDPELKPYTPGEKITGHIRSLEHIDSEGSDTISQKLVYVAQRFNDFHPEVKIHFHIHGSGKAVSALVSGHVQMGPMSRVMTSSEIEAFVKAFGYSPTHILVAHDAVTVFVHKRNPLTGLTLNQVANIFSEKTSRESITTWGELSLLGPWRTRTIEVFGRDENSGTHAFFKRRVLHGGVYKKDIHEMPGNRAVVEGVAGGLLKKPNGIGYASIAYQQKGVRPLQLAFDESSPLIDPNIYNIQKRFYPFLKPKT